MHDELAGGDSPVLVRVMEERDLAAGLALSTASGWNQRLEDWRLVLDLSAGGMFVALVDGRLAGTLATVNYENRVSWIAMVLVDPAMRRRGIATRLMTAALDHLAACPTIKLDATPAGHGVYEKLGFVDTGRLTRFMLDGKPAGGSAERSVRPMTEADLPAVLAADARVFGVPRPDLLRRLFAMAPAYAKVAQRPGGGMAGFCLGRHGGRWESAGIVTAEDEPAARALVASVLGAMEGRPAMLDALDHPGWHDWLRGLGFVEQRVLTRMVKGPDVPGRPESVYGIAGPEFG